MRIGNYELSRKFKIYDEKLGRSNIIYISENKFQTKLEKSKHLLSSYNFR